MQISPFPKTRFVTCPSECNQPKSVLMSLAKKEQCAVSLKVPYLAASFLNLRLWHASFHLKVWFLPICWWYQLTICRKRSKQTWSCCQWRTIKIVWKVEWTRLQFEVRCTMSTLKTDSWKFLVKILGLARCINLWSFSLVCSYIVRVRAYCVESINQYLFFFVFVLRHW